MKQLISLLCFTSLFIACSNDNAGTSSNTTNSIASLQILDQEGKPSEGQVQIFAKNNSKISPQKTLVFKSDSNGVVDFKNNYPNSQDELPAEFNLQITSSQNQNEILWIDTLSSLANIDTLQLEPAVYLSGDLEQLSVESDSIWIIIEGSEFYAIVDEFRRFEIPTFPKGNFELQIITLEKDSYQKVENYQIETLSESQHFSLQPEGEFFKD